MDDVVNCSIFDLGRDVGYEVILADKTEYRQNKPNFILMILISYPIQIDLSSAQEELI